MTIEQLQLQEAGRLWLGQQEPVDLNATRFGDTAVPRTQERRAAIQELATNALGTTAENVRILEGLFLTHARLYLALVKRDSGEVYVVGTGIEPYQIESAEVSPWRLLSLAVGHMIQAGMLTTSTEQ